MTVTPATPSVALSAARQAQLSYVLHDKRCRQDWRLCPRHRELDLAVDAAYWHAERMRALDAARDAGVAW